MQYSTIAYRVENAILTLTLNRPDRLNAFTVTMADELIHALDRASEDDAVLAIVVTGAGRAFCAGMDLDASVDVGNDDADSNKNNVFGLNEALHPTLQSLEENFDDPLVVNGVRDTGGRVVLAIFDCKKPIIAAINGAAVGVGLADGPAHWSAGRGPAPLSGMTDFLNLLRGNANYRRMWSGQIVSEIGDHFNNIAVFSLAMTNTKSGLVVTGIMPARAIPAILVGPFAGIVLDRFDR